VRVLLLFFLDENIIYVISVLEGVILIKYVFIHVIIFILSIIHHFIFNIK